MVGRVAHRFCIHRCLLCNRISIRFWKLGFTRHEISGENKRARHPSRRNQANPRRQPSLPEWISRRVSRKPLFQSRLCANRVNEVTFYDRFQVLVAPGHFLCPTAAAQAKPSPPPSSPLLSSLPFHSSLEYMLQLRVNSFPPAFPSLLYFFCPLFLSFFFFFFFPSRPSLIAPLELWRLLVDESSVLITS